MTKLRALIKRNAGRSQPFNFSLAYCIILDIWLWSIVGYITGVIK